LKEIAITDHSDLIMQKSLLPNNDPRYGFYPSGARYSVKRWQNVHNDVKVLFGVEGDVINEQGEVCFTIQ
jgi:histidinol phosphatase-like PHP family hydrolase